MPFLDEVGLQRVWSKVLDKLEELEDKLDKTHPVGSLYWSSDPTNPGSLFGGTWTQIKDKFILAAGDTYKIGATGGSADAVVVSHSHSTPKLTATGGNHRHKVLWVGNAQSGFTDYNNQYAATQFHWDGNRSDEYTLMRSMIEPNASPTGLSGNLSMTVPASSTGSQGVSGAGKNMPPYETYYCWKRIE